MLHSDMTDFDAKLLRIVADGELGVLATIRRDGRPQLSSVGYAYDSAQELLRVSVAATRAKTHNVIRDPRAAMHIQGANRWAYAVVDGPVTLSQVTQSADDDAMTELVDLYRTLAGEHPDWPDFHRAMIAERRQVLRLHLGSIYGLAPGG